MGMGAPADGMAVTVPSNGVAMGVPADGMAVDGPADGVAVGGVSVTRERRLQRGAFSMAGESHTGTETMEEEGNFVRETKEQDVAWREEMGGHADYIHGR